MKFFLCLVLQLSVGLQLILNSEFKLALSIEGCFFVDTFCDFLISSLFQVILLNFNSLFSYFFLEIKLFLNILVQIIPEGLIIAKFKRFQVLAKNLKVQLPIMSSEKT